MKIRSVLLLALATLAACSRPNPNPASLIFINGKVWTGTDSSSFVQAVAIRGDTIMATGTTAEIAALTGDSTRIVDLQGRLLIPGFNDAHIHFLGGSIGLTEVDLTGQNTIANVVKTIKRFAAENPDKKWITGRGWQYTMFEGGLPTKEILDSAISDRPVFIRAYDGHSAWANSAALKAANITPATRFPGFGEIVKSQGKLTGVFKEDAMDVVSNVIPPLSTEEKLNALRKGIQLATSYGITSLTNCSGSPEELQLYRQLLDRGELPIRVAATFSVDDKTTFQQIERYTQIKDSVGRNNRLTSAGVKFMLDGVIESHTAGMLMPYSNLAPGEPSPTGNLSMPVERYRELVREFDKRGFMIYTHAIGDRAVREALNAYEYAGNDNGTAGKTRHRIEHIETVSPDDLPRFADLGVLPSMEPIHAEPGTVSVWADGVGKERLPWSFAWASMLKANAHLVYSSDWPACVALNPIRGLHTAVTRRTIDGLPEGGWVPEQRIPITDALIAYTQGGAWSSFEENKKGRIATGQLADVIVLSQDLFSIDPMKTHETQVLMTVIGGQVIFEKADPQP
ncbi:MAG: amidohydrolase [Cyclobacteriaceae bacterium]